MTTESSTATTEPPSRNRRSVLYLLITVCVWSFFFLVQERESLTLLSSSLQGRSSQQQVETSRNYIRNIDENFYIQSSALNNETIHILFGLKGKDPAFLAEFQVALKNVLLQAPLDQPMHIHIIADEEAYQAITVKQKQPADPLRIFVPSLHQKWMAIQPIQIHIYNVQQLLEQIWTPFLKDKFQSYSFQSMTGHHTVGAFFRLLAHQILLKHDPTIQYVIYLDPDVLFLANVQAAWKERPIHNPDILFAWGASMCSGFLLLNIPRLDFFWQLSDTLDLQKVASQYKQSPNDQLFLRAMNVTHPDKVVWLPPAWDINIADGIWKMAKTIVYERPQIGMMHFNGGPHRTPPEPYYKVHDFLTKPELVETWGVALYYARMPWTWARYLAESQIPANRPSYPLEVHLHPTS
jgi:hypothetical protein